MKNSSKNIDWQKLFLYQTQFCSAKYLKHLFRQREIRPNLAKDMKRGSEWAFIG